MTHAGGTTVWVFGDQLHRELGAMRTADPGRHDGAAGGGHRAAGRPSLPPPASASGAHRDAPFAAELRAAGFRVDHRRSATPARQVLELLDSGEL
jgi:hypothetical protein